MTPIFSAVCAEKVRILTLRSHVFTFCAASPAQCRRLRLNDDPQNLDDDGDGGDTVNECLAAGGAWDPSDTITGCDSDWNCTTSTGQTIGGVCPPGADSCVAGPSSTVVVNGGDGGGYGTGLPLPGCAFYYQSGAFIGTQCGNGSMQNTPVSWQGAVAAAKGTQMAGRALPAVCGGGVFVFAGPEGENGGGGFLAEYDSNSGGSLNVFGEGTNPTTEAGGGAFSNVKNGVNPFFFIPAAGDGGVVVFDGGIGLYAGEAAGSYGYGGGAYVNITSVAACH